MVKLGIIAVTKQSNTWHDPQETHRRNTKMIDDRVESEDNVKEETLFCEIKDFKTKIISYQSKVKTLEIFSKKYDDLGKEHKPNINACISILDALQEEFKSWNGNDGCIQIHQQLFYCVSTIFLIRDYLKSLSYKVNVVLSKGGSYFTLAVALRDNTSIVDEVNYGGVSMTEYSDIESKIPDISKPSVDTPLKKSQFKLSLTSLFFGGLVGILLFLSIHEFTHDKKQQAEVDKIIDVVKCLVSVAASSKK